MAGIEAVHEFQNGWTYVPTMGAPHGAIEVQLSEETKQILLVTHDNQTVGAWAADLTMEQAQWLAEGLHRAIAMASLLRGQA